MNKIGDNNPPDMAQTATSTMRDISAWLSEHPIVDSEEAAREAKLFIDRGKLGIQDLEEEREAKVRPLNSEVQKINDHYRSPRTLLQKVLDELKNRVSAFIKQEEEKRIKAAEESRRKAEEAEQAAREAERLEREAMENAAGGELGIDVAQVTEAADTKFAEFQKAQRQAALAERDSRFRLGGGFGRAIGNRNKETLIVENAVAAVMEMADNEGIHEAIIKAARAYRSTNNRLPPGIISKIERKL